LVKVSVNPLGRFGAPETEPGPSGMSFELMMSPFQMKKSGRLTLARGAALAWRRGSGESQPLLFGNLAAEGLDLGGCSDGPAHHDLRWERTQPVPTLRRPLVGR